MRLEQRAAPRHAYAIDLVGDQEADLVVETGEMERCERSLERRRRLDPAVSPKGGREDAVVSCLLVDEVFDLLAQAHRIPSFTSYSFSVVPLALFYRAPLADA